MTNTDVERLHKLFVDLTGRDIPLDLAGYRASQWFAWNKERFTDQDLRLVVAHVKKGIREGRRNEGALKFVNMIGDVLRFGEDLAEAKALARTPKTTPRDVVLAQSGRPRRIEEYKFTPAGEAAFEALRKLKESL